MKLLILSFFLISVTILNAQELSGNIKDLYNENNMTSWTAIKAVRDDMDTAAIPHLHHLLEKKPPFLQLVILKALNRMGDKSVEERTLDLIKRADSFAKHQVQLDPLEAKVDATEILFELGNFSTAHYVFEVIKREKPKVYSTSMKLLPLIMKNLPHERDKAKDELLFILQNNKESYYRLFAMKYLFEEFGDEMLPYIKIRFEKDEDKDIRNLAESMINGGMSE